MNNNTPDPRFAANESEPPTFDSADHLSQISCKLFDLDNKMDRLIDVGRNVIAQIVSQVDREGEKWCPCRLYAAIYSHQANPGWWSNELSIAVSGRTIDNLAEDAETCPCRPIWLTGKFPLKDKLPERPGVYICFDTEGRAAYIGTSKKDVRGRLRSHFSDPDKPVLERWSAFFPGRDGDSAAVWEVRLIEEHQPYLNRQHVEDRWTGWTPQGPQPKEDPRHKWFHDYKPYLWYREHCARAGVIENTPDEKWMVAGVIRKSWEAGLDCEEIAQAHDIVLERATDLRDPWAYFCAILRNKSMEVV